MLVRGIEYNEHGFSERSGTPLPTGESSVQIAIFLHAWSLLLADLNVETHPDENRAFYSKFLKAYRRYRESYITLQNSGVIVGTKKECYGQTWGETGREVTLLGIQATLEKLMVDRGIDTKSLPSLTKRIQTMMDEAHLVLDPTQDAFGYSVPDYWARVIRVMLTTNVWERPEYRLAMEMEVGQIARQAGVTYDPPAESGSWTPYHIEIIEQIVTHLKASDQTPPIQLLTASLGRLQNTPWNKHHSYSEFSLENRTHPSDFASDAIWVAMKAAYLAGNRKITQRTLAAYLNAKGLSDIQLDSMPGRAHLGIDLWKVITFAHGITPKFAASSPTAA